MSALTPKADICSALTHVRFVPIADIEPFNSATCRRAARDPPRARLLGLTKKALLRDFGIFRMPLMVGKISRNRAMR